MDNIIDIKNAVETLKPILNQSQINMFSDVQKYAVDHPNISDILSSDPNFFTTAADLNNPNNTGQSFFVNLPQSRPG